MYIWVFVFTSIFRVLLHFQHIYITVWFHELHKCCNVRFNFLKKKKSAVSMNSHVILS